MEPNNYGISDDALVVEPFTLTPLDESKDYMFQSRLDMETALLRRRYEIVIGERCPRMKNLDGLLFRRVEVCRKDVVYDELKRVGLIRNTRGPNGAETKTWADGQIQEGKVPDRGQDQDPVPQ